MNKNSFEIVNIIPLTKLKNDLDFFSYQVPLQLLKKVKPGQLVKINFRNRNIQGLVLEFSDQYPKNYKLKNIESILDPQPLLTEWQLDLIKKISSYYLVSMATVALALVPEIPKKNKESGDKFFSEIKFQEFKENFSFGKVLSDKSLVKYRQDITKIAFIKDQISLTSKNEQIAIIVPELIDIKKIVAYLEDELDDMVVYLNNLPKNRHFANWLRIKNGQAKIIIGTRSAIFAPFSNLTKVIIVDDNNHAHKQEEPNPRYRVQKIADFLSNFFNLHQIYLSRSPSLEVLHQVAVGSCDFWDLESELPLPKIKIIDQSKEVLAKNFSPVSNYLDEQILDSLRGDKKVLLLLDRKGYFTDLICKSCQKEMSLLKKSNFSDVSEIVTCPACQSHDLRPIGLGIKKIQEVLQDKYPQVNIFSFTADDAFDENTIEQYVQSSQIILTTSYGWRRLSLLDYSLISVLSADILLNISDYTLTEETFLRLYEIISSLTDKQRVVLQTRNFENPIFSALLNYSLKAFYLSETTERKHYAYPPFSRLIKLIYKNKNLEVGQRKVQDIFQKLKSKIEISPPYLAHDPLRGGNYLWRLIVKLNKRQHPSQLDFLRKEDLIIDVDPLNTL